MTTAYCKYGFESGSFGSGTTSTWEYMPVSNVTLSIQTASQSYNKYTIGDPRSYQVADELITQSAVSGSFTFYYTTKTMVDFLKAMCWNTPSSGNLYIVPITDTPFYSMTIEMGDITGSNEFGFRLSGVIINSLKFNCRINDYITVEIGFVAQSYTPLEETSIEDYVERTVKTFLDSSYNSATMVGDSTINLTNLSAYTIALSRSLTSDTYIIGSKDIHRFYDVGYTTVTCDITYSDEEYATYDQFFDSSTLSTITLGMGANEHFTLYILETQGMNQGISYNLNAAGKTEKTLSFKCGHNLQMNFGG